MQQQRQAEDDWETERKGNELRNGKGDLRYDF